MLNTSESATETCSCNEPCKLYKPDRWQILGQVSICTLLPTCVFFAPATDAEIVRLYYAPKIFFLYTKLSDMNEKEKQGARALFNTTT